VALRVLATADLHYCTRYAPAVLAFAREVVAEAPDVLIVAGDVGEGLPRFRACLEAFAGLPSSTAKLVVAGNHDVWRHDDVPHASAALLDRALPEAARAAGFTWLEADSVVVRGVAFAGSMAWYDWSGVDPRLSPTPEAIVAHKRRVWVDAWRVDWPESDPEVSRRLGDALMERLAALDADPVVRRSVVATHVPPWTGGLPRRPEYGLTAAFFVNLGLGERLARVRKLTHVVAGHIHRAARQTIAREGAPPIDFQVVPSDYGAPAAVRFEVEEG
jgi:predicted phosphohydrolase